MFACRIGHYGVDELCYTLLINLITVNERINVFAAVCGCECAPCVVSLF